MHFSSFPSSYFLKPCFYLFIYLHDFLPFSITGGNGNPFQYSCWENPSMWGHKQLDTTEDTHTHTQIPATHIHVSCDKCVFTFKLIFR